MTFTITGEPEEVLRALYLMHCGLTRRKPIFDDRKPGFLSNIKHWMKGSFLI